MRQLLAPSGQILIELEHPDAPTVQSRIRLETASAVSDWFPWAEVSGSDADRFAAEAGLTVQRNWAHDGRWFSLLGA